MVYPYRVWCIQTIIRDEKVYFLYKSPLVFYENYDHDDDDDKYKICSLLLNINICLKEEFMFMLFYVHR